MVQKRLSVLLKNNLRMQVLDQNLKPAIFQYPHNLQIKTNHYERQLHKNVGKMDSYFSIGCF